jgi:uncharacterized protein YaaQ
MNERIRELALQAGFTANDEQKVFLKVYEQELEKFAELIVQECQSRVAQYIRDCGEIGCLPDSVIKKHFGVKE